MIWGRAKHISDCLDWLWTRERSIVFTATGGLMAVVEVVPPDLETASAEESVSHHAAITAALTQLGNGWSVWIDQWRRQDRGYLPPSDFGGNHAACLTDRARRSDFEAGRAVYSNRLYVAVHWVPQGRDATLAYLQDKSPRDRQVILDTFRDGADQLFSELAHQSPSVAMLEGDALATYLAETVTYRRVPTHLPEAFLAQHLGAADWTTVPSLSIDGLHVRAVEVHTFGRATPLTFQVFHELPFEGRWTTTIHFLDRDDQRRTLARLKSEWAPKRYGMLGHLFEATGWKRVEEAERKDIAAIQRNLSLLEESIADTRDGLVIATVTLRVWDPDPALADDRARIVQGHLNARGWRARVATVNETPGAIADIPGNASRERLNARRPLVQLERIGRASPITGLTDGTREDARLGGPALLVAKSRRQGPLFFSLHAPGHDVGHTLLVGQTGGGKSALMKLMVLQHQRYPGSTQTLFDHRRTAMIATLASDDGQWLELGSGGLGVQPLRDLDSPEGFAWAVDWLCTALALRNVPVDADLDHALVEALSALRGLDHGQRTLSAACAHLGAHRAARDALAHYTASGPFGLLLDGVVAGYGSARLLCIDYSKVMGMAESPLILSACFRQVSTERISGTHPKLVCIEEAWEPLSHPLFRAQVLALIRTGRARKVQLCLATQSLRELVSDETAVILEQVKNKIFTAHPEARRALNRPLFRNVGLSEAQIDTVADLRAKAEYLIVTPAYTRIADIELSGDAKALCASSSPEDLARAEAILAAGIQPGRPFCERWLQPEEDDHEASIDHGSAEPEPALVAGDGDDRRRRRDDGLDPVGGAAA
jgi:type IV secretion system protein VirB4